MRRGTLAGLLVLAVAMAGAAGARAQGGGCASSEATDPPRIVLRCKHVTIEIEPGSELQLLDADGNGEPEGVDLNGGALLIDYEPPADGGSFQILTPYAIASVRGTTWVVEVVPERTSVFVVEGVVGVAKPEATTPEALTGVVLRTGDGVDAGPGPEPLQVKQWPAERAGKLLARFGR